MELTILGAGIAGSCAARACREMGVKYRLVDNPLAREGSSVALATVRAPKSSRQAREAIAHYERHRIPVKYGGWVNGYRRKVKQFTVDREWYAVDPLAALEDPTHDERASGPVLNCTASGSGQRTFGYTWFHNDPGALADDRLLIYHIRPYVHLTAVSWDSGCRLGSSTGSTADAALRGATELLDVAVGLGLIRREGWTPLLGTRLRAVETVLAATHYGARFGGFHRDGYLLAPAMAQQAVSLALKAADR